MYIELLLYKTKTNSKEEFTEGHNAYFNSVMIEGQESALKGIQDHQMFKDEVELPKLK